MISKLAEIKSVPFMGADLMAARDDDGSIYAGVSYICNGMGMGKNDKDRQVKNIQADEVLKGGCVKFDAGVFDPNNSTLALKLDYVPLWLAKISITPTMKAENPELVSNLVQYQLRAKDALAAAFVTPATKPMTTAEMFQLQAQINVEQERRLAAIEANQQKVIEACSVPAVGRDEWQENMKKYLSGLCEEYGMSYPVMYDDLYSALERKVGCDLDRRQSNMRKRLKAAGATYKERQSVSKLTVIAKDPVLTGVFEGIVQRYAAHLASRKWDGRN